MKTRLSGFIALLTILTAVSAQAIVRPGWERPILKAEVETNFANFPRPTTLTMNKKDGFEFATSFTLVEDTGIRCIKAPCPSEVKKLFKIKSRNVYRTGLVRYTAIEVLNTTAIGPIARQLTVDDHSQDIFRSRFKFDWIGFVQQRPGLPVVEFGGNPEPVYTIQ